MFKGITQTLSERRGEPGPGMHLDPALVAASFGAVYAPNAPLPDTGLPDHHAENDAPSTLRDTRKSASRPTPKPLLTLALNRLKSIKPRSKEMNQRVAQMIADCTQLLPEFDLLVATLEQEELDAWEARWNADREKGRELIDVTIPRLRGRFNGALQRRNETERVKVQCKTKLQTLDIQRQRTESYKFATEKEIASIKKRVADARMAMEAASAADLEAERNLGNAEAALATAEANLANIKNDMEACEARIAGAPYFDPALGLSTDPKMYQDKW